MARKLMARILKRNNQEELPRLGKLQKPSAPKFLTWVLTVFGASGAAAPTLDSSIKFHKGKI